MRITQEADYAIRIAVLLYKRDSLTDAKTISDEIKVPIRYTLKILRKLVQGEIIRSFKGIRGGYRLPMTENKTSLAQIIEVIDGPIRVTRCFAEEYECSINGLNKDICLIRQTFSEVNDIIYEKLRRCTIDKYV